MRKVLFVEDDALISRVYVQKLTEQGFEVATAADGLEAIKQLPVFKPDLVVLDLLMPKLSGVDVLKYMRQRPDLRNTRVIVFSNAFLSGLVEQVASMGVEAALVKATATPARVVEVINETLEKSDRERAPAETKKVPGVDAGRFETSVAGRANPAQADRVAKPVVLTAGDSELIARIGQEFLDRAPAVFKELRQLCRELLEADGSPRETGCLLALNQKLGFLTQITGLAGSHQIAELSSALEALVFELAHKPGAITDSSRQTITATIVFLADRFDRGRFMAEHNRPPASILVVDDDSVSNLAVVQSLNRAKLSAVSVTDPLKALELLRQTPYDAVLLDVSMPAIDGLDLCEQMRNLPLHKRTPVIFVTGFTDFKTYARSILSGGNDLIAKPISPAELCVKVITHLLKQSQ